MKDLLIYIPNERYYEEIINTFNSSIEKWGINIEIVTNPKILIMVHPISTDVIFLLSNEECQDNSRITTLVDLGNDLLKEYASSFKIINLIPQISSPNPKILYPSYIRQNVIHRDGLSKTLELLVFEYLESKVYQTSFNL